MGEKKKLLRIGLGNFGDGMNEWMNEWTNEWSWFISTEGSESDYTRGGFVLMRRNLNEGKEIMSESRLGSRKSSHECKGWHTSFFHNIKNMITDKNMYTSEKFFTTVE